MSFSAKKSFFEAEILGHGDEEKRDGGKFKYLQQHEVDKMRNEEGINCTKYHIWFHKLLQLLTENILLKCHSESFALELLERLKKYFHWISAFSHHVLIKAEMFP